MVVACIVARQAAFIWALVDLLCVVRIDTVVDVQREGFRRPRFE